MNIIKKENKIQLELELDLESTKLLGSIIGENTNKQNTILLFGDLGSGKTTIAQSIIKSYLKKEINVSSPTFQIIKHYSNELKTIYHLDLYRLNNGLGQLSEEIDHILRNQTSIIEWPEIISELVFNYGLFIKINFVNDKKRKFTLSSNSNHWTKVIKLIIEKALDKNK